jgi:hypothetical protein
MRRGSLLPSRGLAKVFLIYQLKEKENWLSQNEKISRLNEYEAAPGAARS